jgi:DNA-binding transcriptional LysR family regulator
MLSVTLRQLEYATATAQHGGMTAAAAALNVSQPALSVALSQLESLLGQPLFLRRPGGRIQPTAFGRGWLDEAQVQLDAVQRLMAGGSTPAAPVRLGVFEDLAPAVLAPLLRILPGLDPDLRIDPQVLGFEALTDALRNGRIDLALTWDLGLDTQIDRTVLTSVAPHAVLAADHPLGRQKRLTLAQVADHPLILTDQGLSLGHMRALFAQKGLTPQIAHRTATLELMRSFAANGLGVGVSYSRPAGRRSHDGRGLVARAIVDAGSEPVVLAQARGNALPPAALRLRDLLPQALPFAPGSDTIPPDAIGDDG